MTINSSQTFTAMNLYNIQINSEFTHYLNRHLKGILFLRHKIKNISLQYELADAFSNYSCRLQINIEFWDVKSFSREEEMIEDKFLYNRSNSSGGKYISFVYKKQRSSGIDIEEIKSFITFYQFTENIFQGFVKDLLPKNCTLNISELNDPLFIYLDNFLKYANHSRENREFEKEYKSIFNRSYDFDVYYHLELIERAQKFENLQIEDTITDEELFENKCCEIEDIRRFVLNENIPFKILGYSHGVDSLNIDSNILLNKLKKNSKSETRDFDPAKIIKIIVSKINGKTKERDLLEELKVKYNIEIGDYIYYKDKRDTTKEELGIVKNISIYNNELDILVKKVKINLEESKLHSDTIEMDSILFSLKPSKLQEIKKEKPKIDKRQLIGLIKKF